jgi:hypothetical protein
MMSIYPLLLGRLFAAAFDDDAARRLVVAAMVEFNRAYGAAMNDAPCVWTYETLVRGTVIEWQEKGRAR